jgi:PadR family transcriptional regulator, regulatory protein PadR
VASFLLETKMSIYALGPLHGYGIARRIEQISPDVLAVNQGTLYPVLLKLEQEGAIRVEGGASENNRRAPFYRLTKDGRKQLQAETRNWEQTAAIMIPFFEVKRRICHEVSEAFPCASDELRRPPAKGRTAERGD